MGRDDQRRRRRPATPVSTRAGARLVVFVMTTWRRARRRRAPARPLRARAGPHRLAPVIVKLPAPAWPVRVHTGSSGAGRSATSANPSTGTGVAIPRARSCRADVHRRSHVVPPRNGSPSAPRRALRAPPSARDIDLCWSLVGRGGRLAIATDARSCTKGAAAAKRLEEAQLTSWRSCTTSTCPRRPRRVWAFVWFMTGVVLGALHATVRTRSWAPLKGRRGRVCRACAATMRARRSWPARPRVLTARRRRPLLRRRAAALEGAEARGEGLDRRQHARASAYLMRAV